MQTCQERGGVWGKVIKDTATTAQCFLSGLVRMFDKDIFASMAAFFSPFQEQSPGTEHPKLPGSFQVL